MSFIIGATHKNELMLASDTKVSSAILNIKYPDIQKIHPITSQLAIGVVGKVKFGENVIKHINEKSKKDLLNFTSITDFIELFIPIAFDVSKQFKKKYSSPADGSFVIGLIDDNKKSNIAIVTVEDDVIKSFINYFTSGDYCYLFAFPSDVDFGVCKNICDEIFENNSDRSLENILPKIITEISSISNLVNDKVHIWKAKWD